MSGWDIGPDGNVICWPFTSMTTAAMNDGMAGLMRFEYLSDQSDVTKHGALQLAITVNEVGRLIAELQVFERQLKANLAADKPSGKPS